MFSTKKVAAGVVQCTFFISVLWLVGCSNDNRGENNDFETEIDSGFVFVALPAISGVPAGMTKVQGWIDTEDKISIREHTWDIWSGLTADSGESHRGEPLPVWETWYTPEEIYVNEPANITAVRARSTDFENPHNHFRESISGDEVISSFNKYNRLYADHVWSNQYNIAEVLTDLNDFFTFVTQPTVERKILGFPQGTAALKPVFFLVAQAGLTPIPYWRGPDNSSDSVNPTPDTWNQCVAVDATSSSVGNMVSLDCNGTQQTMEVIALEEFYAITLTQEEINDIVDVAGNFSQAVVGDYAVLVAMHVTTKEIPNWTWQTFWWDPYPEEASFPAESRPANKIANLQKPWSNFAACSAYSMVSPSVVGTEAVICFNPHLETGLGSVDGIASNCMSCHFQATWGEGGSFGGGLDYQTNGFYTGSEPAFSTVTKLDFLWSLTRAAATENN